MTSFGSHFHWFSYYNGLREGRSLKPHHVRDGGAFPELCVPLQRRGLEYGQLIPNGPPTPEEYDARVEELNAAQAQSGARRNIEDVVTYSEIDDSCLRPGDVLVVPTRPPMNDLDHGDKVRSQPGFTTLEQRIFRILRRYLDVCSRSHVRFTQAVAERLHADYFDRADVTFRQVLSPTYIWLERLNGGKKHVPRESYKTAAYVFYQREVESLRGADLLVAFGMGGTQTLMICNRLRHDLAWVLEDPGFTMFEMTAQDEEAAGGGLEYVDRWSFDVVLRTACLPEASVASMARARPAPPTRTSRSVPAAGPDSASAHGSQRSRL